MRCAFVAESLFCLQWDVALQAVILHDIYIYIYQRFRKHFFFISSTLLACKNENLWCFSPYSVTTTYNHMTYNWPNYIPHSLIFKRMQNNRIADNIRAFSFLLTNWSKEPDEERIYRWTEFFTSWTIANKKCSRAHVQHNKSIYLSIYLSIWKPYLLLLFWLFLRFWLTQIPRTIRHHRLALTKFGKPFAIWEK